MSSVRTPAIRLAYIFTILMFLTSPARAEQFDDKGELLALFWGDDTGKTSVKIESDRLKTVLDTVAFSPEELSRIRSGINSLAVQNYIDSSKRQVTSRTTGVVETVITEKLIDGGVRVRECLECNSAPLVIDGRSIGHSGSSTWKRRLETLSGQVRVDGFLLWTVYSESEKIHLRVTAIQAGSGKQLLAKTFVEPNPVKKEEEVDKDPYRVTISAGLWGVPAEKVFLNLPTETYRNAIGAISLRFVKTANDNRSIQYGLGGDYFSGVLIKDGFDLNGFTFYGHLVLALDKYLFGTPDESLVDTPAEPDTENMSPESGAQPTSAFNYYLSVGEAFFMNNHTELIKTGIEFRMGEHFVIDTGLVSLPKKGSVLSTPSGYDPTIYFGGTSYEIILGYSY